jgi:hypothetical protein
MPVSVAHLDEGVIELVFPAVFALDELYIAVDEALALAVEHECRRVLVDTRASVQKGNAFDILTLAEDLASLPLGTIEREAVLTPPVARPAADMDFFETAARNRGLNVRLFQSREDALGWLTG